jgi:hypothetical protein
VHENIEEMVISTVRMGERVQTMDRQAVTVDFPEAIAASLIAIVMIVFPVAE